MKKKALTNLSNRKSKTFTRCSVVSFDKESCCSILSYQSSAHMFYKEAGNWNLDVNHSPVNFINNPKRFNHFIHTQKRDTKTNDKDPTPKWDFYYLIPENSHQVIRTMSEQENQLLDRHQYGFGCHAFSNFSNKMMKTGI